MNRKYEQPFVFFQNTLEAWKWVYLLAAGIYLLSGTTFLAAGSTETQSWNSQLDTQ